MDAAPARFASEQLLCLPTPRYPEDRLMLAVIVDAVALLREDAFGVAPHPRSVVLDTLRWFASDDTSWPLSFCNVCCGLGLDPAALRAGLERELAVAGDWQVRVSGGEVRAFPPRAAVRRRDMLVGRNRQKS